MANLPDQIAGFRKMRRSMSLRNGDLSQEDIINNLDEIVKSAITMQAVGTQRMQKRAVEELKQTRQDLIAGQVKVSSKVQDRYVGMMSQVVNELEEVEVEKKKVGGAGKGAAEALSRNLPDPDTIISALMTANPLFGYSTKIMRDMFSSMSSRKKQQKELSSRQAELWKEREAKLEEEIRMLKMDAENGEEDKPLSQEEESAYDKQLEKLEGIYQEVKLLREIWDDSNDTLALVEKESTETSDSVENLTRVNTESAENLTQVNNKTAETLERLREDAQDDIDAQRVRNENAELASIEAGREGGMFTGSGTLGTSEGGKKGFDFTGLMAGIGAGFMSGLSAVMATLGSVAAIGGKVLRMGVRASMIGTVIMGLYDFVEGFFNAAELLDLDEAKVTIKTRLMAGVSNVVAGIIDLGDWVAGLFGFDLIGNKSQSEITKDVYAVFQKLVDRIADAAKYVIDLFTFEDGISVDAVVEKVKKAASDFMDTLVDVVPDFVTDAFKAVTDIFENGKDAVLDWLGIDEDEVNESVKNDVPLGHDPARPSMPTASQRMSDSVSSKEQEATNPDGNGATIVNAPNSSVVNNNNTTVQGSKNTDNPESTLRRSQYRDMRSLF